MDVQDFNGNALVEVVENQRFWGVMWGPPLIPNLDWPTWSDASGRPVQLARPPVMDGQGGWFVVRLDSTDEDGWLYGTTFDRLTQPRPGGRASKRVNDAVRSRVWRRFNADTELQPMHAQHLAAAVSAYKGGPTDALNMQGYRVSGGQILSALTSNAIFKQETKPSVFRMWQLLMQLWNDSARRHGVLKVMPLDPVGLYLAVKAHTVGAVEMRKAGIKMGRMIVAGACQAAEPSRTPTPAPATDITPAALPDVLLPLNSDMADLVSRGPLAGMQLPTTSSHPTSPNPLRPSSGHHQLGMGPPRAFSPSTRDARGDTAVHTPSLHGRYNRRSHPHIPSTFSTPYPADVARQQQFEDGTSQLSTAQHSHDPTASPGFQVVSLRASDVMNSSGPPQPPVTASNAPTAQPPATGTAASWFWPWKTSQPSKKQRPTTDSSPDTDPTGSPATLPSHPLQASPNQAALLDEDTPMKRQQDSPGSHAEQLGVTGGRYSGSGSKSGAGLPRVRSGMLPDMDEPAALVQELMTITNYARAAYGYVMAAGHMATITSLIQMVGASAFFNPVSGASAEANNQAIQSLTGIPKTDILLAEWRNHVFKPCHFLALDRLHGRLVLCIRGSMELGDICTDLAAQPSPFELGGGMGMCHVHQGLISAALYVEQSTQAALQEAAEQYPDWPLLITGHSLGAGVASLLAIMWKFGHRQQPTPSPWADRMYCVAVACPPVVSESVAAACDEFVISMVHHMDFVPRLSHYSVELALVDMVRSSPAAQLADNLSATLAAMSSTLPWVNSSNNSGNNSNDNSNNSISTTGSTAQRIESSTSTSTDDKAVVVGQGVGQQQLGTQQADAALASPGSGGGGGRSVDGGSGDAAAQAGTKAQLHQQQHSVTGEQQQQPAFEVELITQRNPYTAVQQLSKPRRELSLPGSSRSGSGGGGGGGGQVSGGGHSRQGVGMEGLAVQGVIGELDEGCQESFISALFGGAGPDGTATNPVSSSKASGKGAGEPGGGQAAGQQDSESRQAGSSAEGAISSKLLEYWSDILEVVKPRDSQVVDIQRTETVPSEDSGTLQAVAEASRSMTPEAIVARSTSAHHPLSPAWQASFTSTELDTRPASFAAGQPAMRESRRTSRLRHRTVDDVRNGPEIDAIDVPQGPPSLSDVMNQVVDDFEAAIQEKQSRDGSSVTTPTSVTCISKEDVAERLAPTKLYLPGRVLWIMYEEDAVVQDVLKQTETAGSGAAETVTGPAGGGGAQGGAADAGGGGAGGAAAAGDQKSGGKQQVGKHRDKQQQAYKLLEVAIAQDFMPFTVEQPSPAPSGGLDDDDVVVVGDDAALESPHTTQQIGVQGGATTSASVQSAAANAEGSTTTSGAPSRMLSFNVQAVASETDASGDELSKTPLGRSLSKVGLPQRLSQGLRQLKSNVEQVLSKATLEFGQASFSAAGDGARGVADQDKAAGGTARQVVCLLEADRHAFEELSLVASCAGDHIPDSYYSALNQLYAAVLTGRTVAGGSRRQSKHGGGWAGGHAVPDSALPERVRADTRSVTHTGGRVSVGGVPGEGGTGTAVRGGSSGGGISRQGSGTTKSFLDMWRIT